MEPREGGIFSKLLRGFRWSEPAIPAPTPEEQEKIQARIDRFLPVETPESREAQMVKADESIKALRDFERKKITDAENAKEATRRAWEHTLNDPVRDDKPR